ncbi:probable serine/threonine-protein kinase cdc7 isoform X1 [Drosophila albomicans]|uniref:Probable serine/threonine-protein kinase cdc7 isoform X1 n=1 Tax=Drosophila albomicans TaxID=7291 RepID=A0A6P8XP16_DROAB|nr:probable serine/threonine-protein kinase cdc7 isoform X1 [Drosophila albomicans]
MELKVWVEGIQRIVCGVTVNTTCQDVVFALAHATGKVGRFTLIERWRNNERHLAPNENPMKLLLKWGEYANDVQFILQRSENKQQSSQPQQQQQQQQQPQQQQQINNNNNNYAVMTTKKPLGPSNNNNNNNESKLPMPSLQKQKSSVELSYRTKELKKSFGGYDAKQFDNIGIVKGIPQQQQQQLLLQQQQHQQQQLLPPSQAAPLVPKHEKSLSNPLDMTSSSSNAPALNDYNDFYNNNNSSSNNSSSSNGNNNSNQHIYSQLSKSSSELRRASPNELCYNNNNSNNNNINNNSSEHLCDIYANSNISNNNNNNSPELYKQTPTISSNGALVPPPYRDPPPPRGSPMCQSQRLPPSSNSETISNASSSTNPFLSDYEQHNINNNNNNNNSGNNSVNNQCMDEGESMFQATQYNDLLQLIKFQREKITAQQLELQKFDTEIVYLESRERDHAHELEAISREISKADQIFRQGSEQLQTLQYVEEENELVKQQEKTLKSEIALLRSKLANCETELLQCKNKMRLLMDDIELEQQQQTNSRQTVERDFLMEMERIQSDIDQALHNTDSSNKTADNLKKELLMIEHAIAEKKRQVEQLVNEMKEVNLQSLTVTTTEEIKHLLEGPNKQGSSRRIIGSPRQLETAVPTSKNPHGVWV